MATIALFTPHFPPHGKAGSISSTQIIKYAHQHSFIVLTQTHPSAPRREKWNNATVYRILPPDEVSGLMEKLYIIYVGFLCVPIIYRSDVAHTYTFFPRYPLVGKIANYLGTPLIYDCHDLQHDRVPLRKHPGDVYVSVSSAVDEYLRDGGIEGPFKRFPITNPSYITDVQPLDESDGAGLDVIFAGRLVELKGPYIALEAFSEIADQHTDVRLTFLDGGDRIHSLREAAKTSGLSDSVRFIEGTPHREALRHIAAADVLLAPSSSESGPRVVIEAMALQTVPVATDVGFVSEKVNDGETGWIVERDADAISEVLEWCYQNASQLDNMAESASENTTNTGEEILPRQLDELYTSVLS